MKDAPATPVPDASSVSPWIKALVAFHILGIVGWALPRPKAEIVQGKISPYGSDYVLVWANQVRQIPPLSAYVQTSGAWQYWDMFAPDPARTDQWADAEVELRDGTKRVVGYPRMFALNLGDKYMKERYRKFYERAGSLEHAYLWPTFAIQMAREANTDASNPPVAVSLRRHTIEIAPPGQKQPTDYIVQPYYRYILRPGELEKGQTLGERPATETETGTR